MTPQYGETRIVLCEDYDAVGRAAAQRVAECLRRVLKEKELVRAVFAAGESQTSFHNFLSQEPAIAWDRVECFNIDDFWDVRMPESYTCGFQTRRELYEQVKPRSVNLVRYNAPDPVIEVARFEQLIKSKPIDVLCQGIGTSGHLALNEPGDSHFEDPTWVRLVSICEQSKRQLKDDPNFKGLGYVPEKGITLSIPAILSAAHMFTIVPLGLKKPVLTRLAAMDTPSTALPASILSQRSGFLFVDRDSCPESWLKFS